MPLKSPYAQSGYQIGQAAQLSGVSAPNIRYYEKEKLLQEQARGANSYRLYSDDDVHQLRFIRTCRAMDMSLDEVRLLLSLDLTKKTDCAKARFVLDEHLQHVRERLAELRSLARDLLDLRQACDGTAPHCKIMEALHHRADKVVSANATNKTVKKHV
ncbi:MAG: HTH-type transcriptional regulator ZntR [Pseudomonadota bacterium]|jgi:DNA-binding transcriptional MerR regulator